MSVEERFVSELGIIEELAPGRSGGDVAVMRGAVVEGVVVVGRCDQRGQRVEGMGPVPVGDTNLGSLEGEVTK